VGDRATVRPSPHTGYATVDNQVTTTTAAGATQAPPAVSRDVAHADGTHTVTVTGEVPLGTERFTAHFVPDFVAFARIVLTDALRDTGAHVQANSTAAGRVHAKSRRGGTALAALAGHIRLRDERGDLHGVFRHAGRRVEPPSGM
jgi:hypothetical protein